jgi:hypothetical protein
MTIAQAAEILSGYQDALRKLGIDPEPLARQAEALAGLPAAEFTAALRAFHAAADRHPGAPAQDADYGALLLEALGDGCGDPQRKDALYAEAGQRAAIFASGATSGGEGLARMLDVERLAKKRQALQPGGHAPEEP